jgi:uncharacterized membrane protein YccF (DUF307 family)
MQQHDTYVRISGQRKGADMSSIRVKQSPNIIVRIVWFVLLGWWLSGVWTVIAWLLCITIIGLPLGIMMLNALPQVTTLRSRDLLTVLDERGAVTVVDSVQLPIVVRALYFVLVGWWFSALWLSLAWLFGSSIFLLPVSFWMINRAPATLLLTRN